MYYLISCKGVYGIIEKETPRNYDAQYNAIEREMLEKGGNMHGQFSRLDYVTYWMNYYNTGGYEKNGPAKI
jgi:hypothetical protein